MNKDTIKLGKLLIILGEKLKTDAAFLNRLEIFLESEKRLELKPSIDFEKINKLDFFQIIREKNVEDVEKILSDFNVKELREILKKYHFGSPSKLKKEAQIKEYIINQLTQRKTDVFQVDGSSPHTEV